MSREKPLGNHVQQTVPPGVANAVRSGRGRQRVSMSSPRTGHHYGLIKARGSINLLDSAPRLRIIFKRRFEKTPPRLSFMRRRREKIRRTKNLIETTRLSFAEICHAVGLRPDSGARLFRHCEGITMKQYRGRIAGSAESDSVTK